MLISLASVELAIASCFWSLSATGEISRAARTLCFLVFLQVKKNKLVLESEESKTDQD